jgi:hypothetical protein
MQASGIGAMPLLEEISEFITTYGSYLKIHTCLAYASAMSAEEVIDSLLDVAKHDPKHKEVMKQISKTNALVFYEPVRDLLSHSPSSFIDK